MFELAEVSTRHNLSGLYPLILFPSGPPVSFQEVASVSRLSMDGRSATQSIYYGRQLRISVPQTTTRKDSLLYTVPLDPTREQRKAEGKRRVYMYILYCDVCMLSYPYDSLNIPSHPWRQAPLNISQPNTSNIYHRTRSMTGLTV